MQEIAYAKLNLALHVRGRDSDGYHRIETLFAFCEDGDLLSVEPAGELMLEVVGPFADALGDASDNLVRRAAEALRKRFGVAAGASLRLDKRLPVASGIGGGSADAAAALRLLSRLWGLEADAAALSGMAASLGTDIPACVESVTARGEGRGDLLYAVDGRGLAGTPVLLANPGIALFTGPVFAGWDGIDRGALPPGADIATAKAARNDLEPAARALVPEIGDVVERLSACPGVRLARMSGSGATCFALFETAEHRDAAAAAISVERAHWWCLPTRLR